MCYVTTNAVSPDSNCLHNRNHYTAEFNGLSLTMETLSLQHLRPAAFVYKACHAIARNQLAQLFCDAHLIFASF